MTKFSIVDLPEVKDINNPVLYTIFIGNKYYVHKGKVLKESAERFLEDVFRGMRGKSCPEYYSNVVEYCNKHPQIYQVKIDVILNNEPDMVLKKESALYISMKNDKESLNRTDLEPFKPEWMMKQSLQKRCETCITFGFVGDKNACYAKRLAFKFCPNCGRYNKEGIKKKLPHLSAK